MSKPSMRPRSSTSAVVARSDAEASACRGTISSSGAVADRDVAAASLVPVGSSRASGVADPTWLPTETSSSRSRASNGARTTVSIFMLSSTSTWLPALTSVPAATGVATTSAGAGARSTPPSSRLTR